MSLEMIKQGPPVSERDVTALEARLGHRLPSDYRRFLLQTNGGRPGSAAGVGRPRAYAVLVPGWRQKGFLINDFLSIHAGSLNDLWDSYEILRNRIPEGTIPVAIDPAGNHVLLATSGDRAGHVFLWDHEVQSGDPDFDHPCIVPIADSFSELINKKLHDESVLL